MNKKSFWSIALDLISQTNIYIFNQVSFTRLNCIWCCRLKSVLRSVIGVWVCHWQTIHYEKESESVNITPLPLLVLELRNREQVSLPICLAQHSHILHLTSQSSDIVSLSQRLTQPVNQAAAFFWRFFSLCGISASHDDTSKWSCAGSKPTASSAWDIAVM